VQSLPPQPIHAHVGPFSFVPAVAHFHPSRRSHSTVMSSWAMSPTTASARTLPHSWRVMFSHLFFVPSFCSFVSWCAVTLTTSTRPTAHVRWRTLSIWSHISLSIIFPHPRLVLCRLLVNVSTTPALSTCTVILFPCRSSGSTAVTAAASATVSALVLLTLLSHDTKRPPPAACFNILGLPRNSPVFSLPPN